MKKEPSDFKKLVQAMLKKRGVTQEQLAEKLDMSASNLSHLLSRGTNDPNTMKIIAQFLKFDMSLFNSNSQIKSHGSTFQQVEKDCQEELSYMKELLKAKDDLIRSKDETIAALRQSMKN